MQDEDQQTITVEGGIGGTIRQRTHPRGSPGIAGDQVRTQNWESALTKYFIFTHGSRIFLDILKKGIDDV